MGNILAKNYLLDVEFNVWSRPDYGGINYSDGDHEEDEIHRAVANTNDLSVLSLELRKAISNWTTAYHLSSLRSNLLRPYKSAFEGKRILEIGAGCGAITRFLGESGGVVLALEGTHRRAKIARSRTRDLSNVQVVCEHFSELEVSEKFEIITLIGVLEYSNLFVNSDHPHQAMLEKVANLLTPGGQLIIAIENQLGLKYFAGAKEDHLGIPFYGIEDKYQSNQPTTFGKEEITQLIKSSGFNEPKFLYPFPDYKMPHCIVSEQGFSHSTFDPSELVAQSLLKDPQYPALPSFQMDMAIPAVIRNKLANHLSNSFLINASAKGSANTLRMTSDALAWHFSASRKAEFFKAIEFLPEEQQVIIRSEMNGSDAVSTTAQAQQVVDNSEYICGQSLTQEIVRRIEAATNKSKCLQTCLLEYVNFILLKGRMDPSKPNNENTLINPGLLDATPSNIIVSLDGSWHLIDQEWRAKENLQIGYLLFRSLMTLVGTHSLRSQFPDYTTNGAFLKACLSLAFGNVNDTLFKFYCQRESTLQTDITGIDPQLEHALTLNSARQDRYSDVAEFYTTQYRECIEIRRGVPDFKTTVSALEQHIAFLNGIVSNNEILIKQSTFQAHMYEDDLAEAKAHASRLEASLSSILNDSEQLRAQLAGVQSSRVWRIATTMKRLLNF